MEKEEKKSGLVEDEENKPTVVEEGENKSATAEEEERTLVQWILQRYICGMVLPSNYIVVL